MDSWSVIEVNVRKLVRDLMEPSLLRITENKENIEKLLSKSQTQSARLDEQAIMSGNMSEQLKIISSFGKKLSEFSAAQSALENKTERDRIRYKGQIESITSKFVNINEKIEVLEHQREQMRTEVAKTTHSITILKGTVENKLSDFFTDLSQRDFAVNKKFESLDENYREIFSKLDQFNEDIAKIEFLTQNNEKSSEKNKKAIKSVVKQIKDFNHSLEKQIENNRNIYVKQSLKQNQKIDSVHHFVNTEFPLSFRLQIHDTLIKAFTDMKAKKVVANDEMDFLNTYRDKELSESLAKRFEEANKRSLEIIEYVEPVVIKEEKKKKPKRTITQTAKRQKTIGKSPEKNKDTIQSSPVPVEKVPEPIEAKETTIDQPILENKIEPSERISSEIEIPQQIDQIETERNQVKNREISDQDHDSDDDISEDSAENEKLNELSELVANLYKEFEEFKENSAKALEESKAHTDRSIDIIDKKFTLELSDYQAMLKEKLSALQAHLQAHSSELSVHSSTFEQQNSHILQIQHAQSSLKHEFEEFADAFQKESAQMLKNIDLCILEYKSQVAQRRKEMSDVSKEFAKAQVEYDSLANTREEVCQLRRVQRILIDTLQMQTHLEAHDEIDKESVTLLGNSDRAKAEPSGKMSRLSPRPTVSIDKKCTTCANPTVATTRAFKMACLAYNPSHIVYRSSIYTRKELIEAKKQLLDGLLRDREMEVYNVLDEIKKQRPNTVIASSRFRNSMTPVSTTMPSPHLEAMTPDDLIVLRNKFREHRRI